MGSEGELSIPGQVGNKNTSCQVAGVAITEGQHLS